MLRLLLVDDERLTRESLRRRIPWRELGIGYIQTAKNGAEALALAGEVVPDIVITDVRMPKMDGLELAGAIRRLYPDCRIVFLSGYADKEYLKTAIRLGAADYLEKPIDVDDFTRTIRGIVSSLPAYIDFVQKREQNKQSILAELVNANFWCDDLDDIPIDGKVADVIRYIQQNYASNQLSIQSIAEHIGLTEIYTGSLFKKVVKMTINQYITRVRIEKAKKLLRNRQIKVSDVAAKVGYADANYFCTLFKKYVGCTLTQFRDDYYEI